MKNGYGDNGIGLYRQGSGVWRSLRDGDFEEEDVWAVIKERKDSNSKVGGPVHGHGHGQSIFEPQNSVKRRLPSASRMIPRASIGTSGSSSSGSSNENEGRGVKQQSAPVTIPAWSKVYGKKSNKGFKHHDYEKDDDDDEIDGHDYNGDSRDSDNEEEEEEDEYNYMIPPHEIVARRQARSQISSFSVFEGVGRTLKGRDLSKVRNAVLTKTGFLE